MNSTSMLSYILLTLVLLIWGIYTIKEAKGKKIFESPGTWISLAILALLIFGNINADKNSDVLNIDDIVEVMKAEISVPVQVDATTTIVDITAEENAIRFHYVVNNIDTTQLTEENLKKIGKAIACQDEGIRLILDDGINMEFSYNVENSDQTYFISVSEKDCL